MFKLVRMDNLEKTNIKFTKSHNPSDIKMKDNNDNIVHVKLYGKAVIKTKCREYLNGRITQEFENGDFEFSFSVPEHETFWYGVILSFGNKAKIIEPQEIIARFEAEPIRKAEELMIKNWWWEPTVEPNDEVKEMIVSEIARFTEFL